MSCDTAACGGRRCEIRDDCERYAEHLRRKKNPCVNGTILMITDVENCRSFIRRYETVVDK